jgi:hypothetical protein
VSDRTLKPIPLTSTLAPGIGSPVAVTRRPCSATCAQEVIGPNAIATKITADLNSPAPVEAADVTHLERPGSPTFLLRSEARSRSRVRFDDPLTEIGRSTDWMADTMAAVNSRLAPRLIAIAFICPVAGQHGTAPPGRLHQADIQVKTLEVTRSRTNLSVRVVIYSENNDEARDARVVILLPVAVGIERLAPGCSAAPGPATAPSLRATVACELGAIADRGYREVLLATSLPPDMAPRRFGVFAYSATPDPNPGNNYAERIIP